MITWLNKRLSEAENTTALVKRVPLAGAYLPSSKGHREAKRTASLPHGPDNTDCIVDSIAQKAMQNYRTSVNTATSTPLTENTGHPPRLRPNSAFNSLVSRCMCAISIYIPGLRNCILETMRSFQFCVPIFWKSTSFHVVGNRGLPWFMFFG